MHPFRAARLMLRKLAVTTLSLGLVLTSSHAQAASLIRDTEIEAVIRDYATPIFKAAGLSSQNIKIHLVSDRSFNAFVVDGQNMFIHTGALVNAKTPNQVIGVIAHEAGHIAGGHLARLRHTLSRARSASLMLQLLGLAAMAAGAFAGGGAEMGQAGAAVAIGGSSAAMRAVLAYQRGEESAADQAAVTYLNATQQSARGMIETFAYFADQGIVSIKYVDPYAQSHPMPQDRIAQLRVLAEQSPYYETRDSGELQHRHDMMRAKLSGFLEAPQIVFNKYPKSNISLPARYARTIAAYKSGGLKPFLPQIEALLEEDSDNPYFLELKGQFLFESGNIAQSIPPLRRAAQIVPQEGLIRIMLAQALLQDKQGRYVDEAIEHLRYALVKENTSAIGYRQLATAYAQKNQIANAELASAQAYMYEGKLKLAKDQATRAKMKLKAGTPGWLQADDIVNFEPPKQ